MSRTNPTDPVRDLAEIRSLLARSASFRALSGGMGLLAGGVALVGAAVAHWGYGFAPTGWAHVPAQAEALVGLAAAVFGTAAAGAVFLSVRKARERGESLRSPATRGLTAALATPLAAGGVLSALAAAHGLWGLVPALWLVFYGLGLDHASRHTGSDVRVLGLALVALGLAAAAWPAWALPLWTIGFGLGHLAYGTWLLVRYEP